MFVIPAERLPPGFAEGVERPPEPPAEPRPAATAVLLRQGADGPEVLLLKRHRQSGFVPGAYVFPGGRVDEEDAHPRLVELAAAGIAVDGVSDADPPARFHMAAIREVFEETGVLLARPPAGGIAAAGGFAAESSAAESSAPNSGALDAWRDRLMLGEVGLLDLCEALGVRPDAAALVPCAHWITPVAEPRRYDTWFLLSRLPDGSSVRPDPREMTDAVWLTPAEALSRFRAGRLPMVFPTVRTLEALRPFPTPEAALEHYRGRQVTAVLPRLVRTPEGVGIVVDE